MRVEDGPDREVRKSTSKADEVIISPDEILKGSRAQKVFLLQSELLTGEEIVVRIQDTGYVFGLIARQHRIDVAALVD